MVSIGGLNMNIFVSRNFEMGKAEGDYVPLSLEGDYLIISDNGDVVFNTGEKIKVKDKSAGEILAIILFNNAKIRDTSVPLYKVIKDILNTNIYQLLFKNGRVERALLSYVLLEVFDKLVANNIIDSLNIFGFDQLRTYAIKERNHNRNKPTIADAEDDKFVKIILDDGSLLTISGYNNYPLGEDSYNFVVEGTDRINSFFISITNGEVNKLQFIISFKDVNDPASDYNDGVITLTVENLNSETYEDVEITLSVEDYIGYVILENVKQGISWKDTVRLMTDPNLLITNQIKSLKINQDESVKWVK